MKRIGVALLALACLAARAPAPDEDARARALFAEIRCVVCQNESIADSQADLAADLRGVVREQVAAGRSNDEIRAFLVERYGEFVLFRPAFSPGNALLWLAPFAVAAAGGTAFLARARRPARRIVETQPLDERERARIQALTGEQAAEPDDRNLT